LAEGGVRTTVSLGFLWFGMQGRTFGKLPDHRPVLAMFYPSANESLRVLNTPGCPIGILIHEHAVPEYWHDTKGADLFRTPA
jgi:hypothetical protein